MQQVFTKEYWNKAVLNFKSVRYLCIAAIVIALRIAVKSISIPIAPGLEITFDCYINALGSIIYGPVVGLFVGAVSDTVGAVLFPSGIYFLPFILTEMLSSFIFGICLWNTTLTTAKVFRARFFVSLICNIILTSVFMKWYYAFFALDGVYNLINLARIAKNLILFPIEATLLTAVLAMILPAIKQTVPIKTDELVVTKRSLIRLAIYFVLSVFLVIAYIIWLKPFLTTNNLKLF